MSGIEIAGLVLAVLPPLVKSVHNAYSKTAKNLFRYEHVVTSLLQDLKCQQALFRSTLEFLLSGQVEEDELVVLLDNPNDTSLWRDKTLERNVRQRVGSATYDIYLMTVKRLAQEVMKLQKVLASEKSGLWTKELLKRFRLCIESGKHVEVLQQIDVHNRVLKELTRDGLQLEPVRRNKGKQNEILRWEETRAFAKGFHCALDAAWLCECEQPHIAHLRLDPRRHVSEMESHFCVLFPSRTVPKHWRETHVKIVADPAKATVSTTVTKLRSVSFASDASPLGSQISSNDTVTLLEKAITHPQTITCQKTSTVSGMKQPSKKLDARQAQMSDLCRELAHCSDSKCLGFLDHQEHKHFLHVVPKNHSGDEISLRKVLDDGGPSISLNLRQKYELAVTLAASVLQLYSTPWLDEDWSNRDIFFMPKSIGSATEPWSYVQKNFDSKENGAQSQAGSPSRETMMPMVRNQTIFSLGVTLIELSLGRNLSYYYETPEERQAPNRILTDLKVANRLLEEVAANEGDRYAKTVNRCINCIFDPLKPDLEQADFRRAFYDNAVVPLKEIYDDFVK